MQLYNLLHFLFVVFYLLVSRKKKSIDLSFFKSMPKLDFRSQSNKISTNNTRKGCAIILTSIKLEILLSSQRKKMFFSPIPDHLSHRNTLNHVDVWKKKIGHGRSVVILKPCVDVLSLINKPVKMRRKKETQSIQKQKPATTTEKCAPIRSNHRISHDFL